LIRLTTISNFKGAKVTTQPSLRVCVAACFEPTRWVPSVSSLVRAAHVHDGSLRPLHLDFQGRDERVFSVNDRML
jgi:hypothetical protein